MLDVTRTDHVPVAPAPQQDDITLACTFAAANSRYKATMLCLPTVRTDMRCRVRRRVRRGVLRRMSSSMFHSSGAERHQRKQSARSPRPHTVGKKVKHWISSHGGSVW